MSEFGDAQIKKEGRPNAYDSAWSRALIERKCKTCGLRYLDISLTDYCMTHRTIKERLKKFFKDMAKAMVGGV